MCLARTLQALFFYLCFYDDHPILPPSSFILLKPSPRTPVIREDISRIPREPVRKPGNRPRRGHSFHAGPFSPCFETHFVTQWPPPRIVLPSSGTGLYILYGIYYIYKDKTFNSRGLFRDLFLYLGILKKEYKFNIVDHSEGVKKKDFNCDF